jgi:hypothetical protein
MNNGDGWVNPFVDGHTDERIINIIRKSFGYGE